jgi:hypothetical protein
MSPGYRVSNFRVQANAQLQVLGTGASDQKKAIWLGKVEFPSVHAEVWKEIIRDPGLCNRGSKRFRDKLPVGEYRKLESLEICHGLYCQYQIQAIRAFYWSCFLVGLSGGITIYYAKTIDLSTGFTVGAYFVGVFALFFAFVGFVLAATKRNG